MKPYNYFDDEEEQPQPSAQVRLAQLVAALQVNGAKLRRTVRRDEEIVEELRDYPNLRRAALKWLAVALFVLAVVIAIISFAVSLHNQSKWNERFCDQAGQVCTDYIAKYGACRWESMDERYGKKMARMTGVSYLRRMDFNGDGRDELLICYLEKGLYFLIFGALTARTSASSTPRTPAMPPAMASWAAGWYCTTPGAATRWGCAMRKNPRK